ncbi:putative ubiquitin hydrolase putativecysteine peptidase Clan CA family C19 [Leptomonas pyrrhocoris]|uniref:Putative ubiquitin hydrolase putativecysteine peptidase Clan CA family C19 n=1 Tax=Leptomonas pyrrhocoris TaxID=157538 RepID=A0A0M9FSP3_LEPPY|nr:putative ubiquitin hydrolase putativecysteine peptidase Clan CA family C19 [Leptomonas pyrrhocoris]KPA75066.1 putative ubiquitin hydrolase putativecysteine peptidase Clan CA family C19 [Leptomonas pyrrhocoris]|eukprot:XP_015653505.1 putative ubiquitin hydrolase putativecysteine peptidase Clan CA family C19 [Leptomonas pyrrhocoris]
MEQRNGSFGGTQSPDSDSLDPYMKVARDESVGSAISSDAADDGGEHSTDRLAVTSSDDSSRSPSNSHDLFGNQSKADGVSGTSAGGPSSPNENEQEEAAVVAKRPAAVGLINEGCTCYLNSLLQLLFHTSYFRTAVYQIPVEGDDEPSVYKALQEIFFQMQERTTPARTTTLTNAFGWGKRELYVQHDIQEMATLLRDNLEERMKGTVTEGAINQLFEGRGEQFVETLDKSYVSRRADTYYDIHIPLGQHHTLYDSLASLTARDQLVGDNRYRVEREGKPAVYMDAEKGYSYTRFPAVTWFHLKRFAMDLTSPTLEMRKVNAPLEFPVELDLRGLEKPEAADKEQETPKAKAGSAVVPFPADSPAIYDLQGVIVHRGTVRSGHYYCYIHEWDSAEQRYTRWLEYDDESVREVPEDVAVRANYGRGAPVDSFRHEAAMMGGANAYILSYVRRSDAPTILAPSPTDIVSDRVKEALRRAIQDEERQLREAEEARMSANLCCLTDATLSAYCDSICSTELYTRDAHQWRRSAECVVTVSKSNTVAEVYEALAAQPALARRGVTADNFRLWRCTDAAALRPTIALPTYAEAVARAADSTRQAACLCDYLTSEENNAALTICVYIDQAKPPLPGLRGLTKEASLIESVHPDPVTRCYTVTLSKPVEAKALHVTLDNSDYAATVEYVTTNTKETLPVAMVSVTAGDNTVALPLNEARKTVSVTIKAYIVNLRHVPVRDVHLELPFGHPLLQPPPSPVTASPLPVLPSIGYDRALIFFKYYDYATNTIQYIGSRLIDRAAKLYCLAAVYRSALGLSDGTSSSLSTTVSETGSSTSNTANAGPATATKQAPAPSMFRYFVERGDHTPVEINEQYDLADFKSGTVVVAQLRAIPAPYRTLCVRNFYRDTRNSLDAHVMEVRRSHLTNDEAYRQAAETQQRTAVAAAKRSVLTSRASATEGGSATTTSTAAEGPAETPGKGPSAMNSTASIPSTAERSTTANGMTESVDAVHSNTDAAAITEGSRSSAANSATPTSAVAAVTAAVEADPTRIAASLNPYEAVQLPILHEAVVEPLGIENYCRLLSSWGYEAVCAAIGRTIDYDPSHIQLYQNCSTGEPAPDSQPVLSSNATTVSDLLYLEAYNPTTVLYYERLPIPREQQQSMVMLTVTLRDHVGHALHRENFTVKIAAATPQALVRQVRQSVPVWQREADPWGTVQDTLNATHYVLCFVDVSQHQIVSFYEVPMGNTPNDDEEAAPILEPSLLRCFEVEVQAAVPLQATERRVACCHMNYDTADRSASVAQRQQHERCAFGQPFLITIDTQTTVRDAQAILLQTTHLPKDALHNAHGYGVMMVAGQTYHFDDWDEHVHLYWMHTKNSSSYVPSLMMNHAKPREKPGSRYVAQYNPQLKISNK